MNIPRFRAENFGSVLQIEVAPYYAFSTFKPDAKTTIPKDGLSLLPGHEWTTIYCSPESMGIQVDESYEPAGKLYTVQLVGFIPGEDIEASEPLLVYDTVPVVAKILTANKKTRIVGTPAQPLVLTANQNTGVAPDTRAGRSLLLTGQQPLPPYYYNLPVL